MATNDEAKRWLKEFLANRKTAQTLFDEKLYSQCAFYCQQTAEMALKAMLYNAGMRPFGHSLTNLADDIEENGVAEVTAEVHEAAAELNQHYIEARYPDAVKSVTPSERYTKEMVEQTQEWADEILLFAQNHLK